MDEDRRDLVRLQRQLDELVSEAQGIGWEGDFERVAILLREASGELHKFRLKVGACE